MLKNLSIKIRIFVLVSLVVIVSFVTLTVIVYRGSYELAKSDAYNLSQETANKYKNEIVAELQGARITAETLSTVFETLKDFDLTDRDMMNEILKNALADKEYITAFCIAYDPNALDGRDAEFEDAEYDGMPIYDATGRYAPYWNKLGGNIAVEYLPDIDLEDWYIVPKTELHEYITDPYPYGLQGKTVMLTSLIFPIIHNEKFIGIISSDIVLDKLQEMVSSAHEQGGYTEIFSHSGTVAAHPDPSMLALSFEEAHPERADEAAAVCAAIAGGEPYISAHSDYYTVYMPIRFSDATNPWSVAVSIPMSSILEKANQVRIQGIIVSVLAIILIAVILYVIANNITKPVLILSNATKSIGEGNFDIDVPSINSGDEIGVLAKSFKFMVEKINITLSELQTAVREANAANEAKSFFLANMSHEIRTPLNAVMGLNTLLLDTEQSEKQRDYSEKISRASLSLLGVVNNILDFSQLDVGGMKLELEPFEIRQMFEDLEILYREQKADSEINLRFELSSDLPTNIVGDPVRLQQIFINLLDNAYKFTEKGSIILRAALSEQSKDSVLLSFAVEDTGIGMSDEQISKLFSVFNQGDNSYSRKYSGTGIGLALSKKMLDLMGGEIRVSSEAGVGATFAITCRFPLPEAPNQTDSKPEEDNSVLQGMRVLLVEDNEINTLIAEELLTNVGIDVTTAENGKEAIEKLDSARESGVTFDLVLMDLQMPVMDGYEATEIIKARPEYKSMPVFALTAHAFPEERQHCLDIGMADHLAKPIDVGKFYAALREVAAMKKNV